MNLLGDSGVNRLGDTSAFVNTGGVTPCRMDGVGIVFEFYTAAERESSKANTRHTGKVIARCVRIPMTLITNCMHLFSCTGPNLMGRDWLSVLELNWAKLHRVDVP